MALKLQEFNVKIVYQQGKESENADALSKQLWEEPLTHTHSLSLAHSSLTHS